MRAPDRAEHDAPAEDAMARGYARSRARADAARAQLRPLAPGERPLGLKLAVALALVVAAGNLAVIAAGGGEQPARGVGFAVVMGTLAAGMWTQRYLAVIAFEALLAVSIVYAALSLAFASNLLAVVLGLVVVAVCGPVFWLLVRVLGRLQVPRG